jgi:predicted nucleic acid-binding protein
MDRGEAAVIQLALIEGVRTVCIDEVVGRRVARLNGLSVTGSIGVLLRARRQGHGVSRRAAIDRMRARGMWLGDDVVRFALREAGEGDSV